MWWFRASDVVEVCKWQALFYQSVTAQLKGYLHSVSTMEQNLILSDINSFLELFLSVFVSR